MNDTPLTDKDWNKTKDYITKREQAADRVLWKAWNTDTTSAIELIKGFDNDTLQTLHQKLLASTQEARIQSRWPGWMMAGFSAFASGAIIALSYPAARHFKLVDKGFKKYMAHPATFGAMGLVGASDITSHYVFRGALNDEDFLKAVENELKHRSISLDTALLGNKDANILVSDEQMERIMAQPGIPISAAAPIDHQGTITCPSQLMRS